MEQNPLKKVMILLIFVAPGQFVDILMKTLGK